MKLKNKMWEVRFSFRFGSEELCNLLCLGFGKAPVSFDSTVQVSISDNEVIVKGSKSTQVIRMKPAITASVKDGHILFDRKDESKISRSLHGLYRSLAQNAVVGVTSGWTKTLEMKGVGYRAAVKGKSLELNLGYSHPIVLSLPEHIEAKVEKQTTIHIKGPDKQAVGQVAAKIRSFRPPEPYLGKGVKYTNEIVRRKAGKTGSK